MWRALPGFEQLWETVGERGGVPLCHGEILSDGALPERLLALVKVRLG